MIISTFKYLLEQAQNDDEETMLGNFWVSSYGIEDSMPVLKIIFNDKTITAVIDDTYWILRTGTSYLIENTDGESETFTSEDIEFMLDVWDQVQEIEVNTVFMNLINDKSNDQ